MEIPTNYKKCDAIVVIDMGSYPARGQIGAELYHRGLADKFVVFVPRRPPYVDFTIGTLGILPQSLIWARGNENNTRIEAKKIESLIAKNGWNAVIVVADYFHILRVRLTLNKLGLNNNIYPVNVPRSFYQSKPTRLLGWKMKELWDVHYSDLSFVSKFRFRHQLTIKTMHEYSGIFFYFFIGYL